MAITDDAKTRAHQCAGPVTERPSRKRAAERLVDLAYALTVGGPSWAWSSASSADWS
jgi:hypothetical protein